VVLLSAKAWAAAEELAELTGARPGQFIEAMLLDLREHTLAKPRSTKNFLPA
jgi:hypothetical protein